MNQEPAATYRQYIGRTESREDIVSPHLIEHLAATLEIPVDNDGALPALWHWMLFQEWAPAGELGIDGHPRRGDFLPPVHDLPRRMGGGGRLVFRDRLYAGEPVTRVSTILRVEEKSGLSGRLIIVTVGHEVIGKRGPAISEEQDIVYRSAASPGVNPQAGASPVPPADAFSRQVHPDPVLLFRYSALTGNGHRIHYDQDYARHNEGYPGLVVHGPLQAIWLADLATRHRLGARLARFSYRGQRAAIAGNALTLEGWRESALVRLQTRDMEGAVCMSAEAMFAAESP